MPQQVEAGGSFEVGPFRLVCGRGLFFVIGPCVIESKQLAIDVALEVARICRVSGTPILFKSSFDKANRTSVSSFRGPGLMAGLEVLAEVRERTGLPVVSDIHTPDQAPIAAEVLDVIQIPAFLSRQTDLLLAAGRTGKPVNVKKGQFQAPGDVEHSISKILSTGNNRIIVTERGSSFGYGDLVADMRSIVWMKRFGFPVLFDATHSAQFPGRGDGASGGDRSVVPALARAAVATGADGVFLEVHPDPDSALCDGPNSLRLADLESLLSNLIEIRKVVPSGDQSKPAAEKEAGAEKALESWLDERLKKICLIIFDVDGVLTDGRITFAGSETEIKSFDVRDGHGIKIAKRCGLESALVTGRTSEVVSRRAAELGITYVFQNVWDKKPVLAQLLKDLHLDADQVAVVGDDVVDIPMLRRAGVGFTVPDAPDEVRSVSDYVTRHRGGYGAAREVVEMILRAQGKWKDALTRYYE
jgi:2-dehydro-3-deoxyphosphooctonate aldolase (KDO 8-P synthase)